MSQPDTHYQLPDANAVLALKGSSFHWARYLLGQKHAARATRLYHFCRYVDDVADEALSITDAKTALLALRQEIILNRATHAITQDVLSLMQECAISPELMLALIDGVLLDLEPVQMQSVDELLRYCYHVAGTVGLMMCKVLDVNDAQAYPFAIDLGIAMQLTNICRDVSVDAKLGRCYLPATMLNGLTLTDLENPHADQKPILQQCIANILTLADTYYSSGKNGFPYIGLRPRCSIAVAASVYRQIGVVLISRQFQYWQSRAVVSKKIKLLVSVHTLCNAAFNKAFWRNRALHQVSLHVALIGLPMINPLASNHQLSQQIVKGKGESHLNVKNTHTKQAPIARINSSSGL